MLKIDRLRTEFLENPTGIEIRNPGFSWVISGSERNISQYSYRIICSLKKDDYDSNEYLLWDSENVISDQSVQVEYKGAWPGSGKKVYWKVKVTTSDGQESEWSDTAFWISGISDIREWKAQWIEPDLKEKNNGSNPCPFLRKEFSAEKQIKSAMAFVTCHGLYELRINGSKIGNQELTPGWTSYHKRLQYQVYDVSENINTGKNAVGVILGDGWYRGFFGWQGKKNLYGDKTALLFQLEIEYSDGSKFLLISDKSWKSSTGPIIMSEIYHGEEYDSTLEITGWDLPGFDDSIWKGIKINDFGYKNLVPSEGNLVKVVNQLLPVKKIITPRGETVFDFGQNMVGRIKFILNGEDEQKITITHAETLDNEGNFYVTNLRKARQQITYHFHGKNAEEYTPRFTFMGFRYIKIENYTKEIGCNNIVGQVIHSDIEFTGNFRCSDPLINRLQENIQWGLRGNFVDIPTDCPQRDERMGWTGDAQVFAPTACFNANCLPFFRKWLGDVAADQRNDGSIPWVVPMVIEDGGGTGWSDGYGATGWADASIIIPWIVYQKYGDKKILQNQYQSMRAWEEFMICSSENTYIFNKGFHFGDWLSFAEYSSYIYNAPDYGFAGAHTEKDLISTAYFYYSTTLMVKTAKTLGYQHDEERYASLLPKIREAFKNEFITPNGNLVSNTQTAYSLALVFGLIPDEYLEKAQKKLADNVLYFQHLTTGFLGTPVLCDALTASGHEELAYNLLFNTKYPSWLYPVLKGATTIWERWDGIKPDGSFQDAGMNSFNHYAYGAIGNWLYTQVAGIQSVEDYPGFKKFIIKPLPDRRLTFVSASYLSVYGQIRSEWEWMGNKLILQVEIPANTKATIFVPCTDSSKVLVEGKPISENCYLNIISIDPKYLVIEAGSGEYRFESFF